MNAKIEDLMVESVVTTHGHKSIGHVKEIMHTNGISAVPVVAGEGPGELQGIVTSTDMLDDVSESSPVSTIMSEKVFTVPRYGDPSLAARVMRNQGIHHVVVTHEQEIVGILTSFDLLRLVEDHRFVMKNAPTRSTKGSKNRR